MDYQFVSFRILVDGKEQIIGFAWFSQENKTVGMNFHNCHNYQFDCSNLTKDNLNEIENDEYQIKQCMQDKLLPYTHEIVYPWTPYFWNELAKVMRTSYVKIVPLWK